MPVRYIYPGAAVSITEGSTVFKIRSKSGATDDNVPYLRWAVPAQTAPASPLVAATWTLRTINGVSADQLNPDGIFPTGALRASAATEDGYSLWELPLAAGPTGDLGYSVAFTDAAGNSTTRNFAIRYTLVGAPVVAVRDDAFASNAPPGSFWAYGYHADYKQLIGAARSAVRWVLYNPNPEVVWVASSHSGTTASWTEYWGETLHDNTLGYSEQPSGLNDDGQSWVPYADWYSDPPAIDSRGNCYPYVLYSPPGRAQTHCVGPSPFPCDASTKPVHYIGDQSATFLRCESRQEHWNFTNLLGGYSLTYDVPVTPTVLAATNALPTGGEASAAPSVSFAGRAGWSMPAAAGNTASTIALYAQTSTPPRSSGGVRVEQFPLSPSSYEQSFTAGWLYKLINRNTTLAGYFCEGLGCLTNETFYWNQGWVGYYFVRTLNLFMFSFSGQLTLETNPNFQQPNASAVSTWPSLPFSVVR